MSDYLNVEMNYPELLAHFMEIILSVEGEKPEEDYMVYAHGLAIKILRHCIEIHSLFLGSEVTFDNKTIYNFIDISSINVLTRVVLEAFSALYYVFCDSKVKDDIELRFHIWQLGGYIERQGYNSEMEESKIILENEAIEIEKIKEKIITNNSFIKLSIPIQNKAKSGDWKLGMKIPELVEKAGFNKIYVGKTYSFLCSSSHNSWSSVMQVYKANNVELQKDISHPILQFSLMLLANTIYCYSDYISKANEVFKKNKYRYDCTIAWKNFGLSIKSSEAEVLEFIEEKLGLEKNKISKKTTFESLDLNEIEKTKLVKLFAEKKFYDFHDFEVTSMLSIEDLVNQYKTIRDKNTKI